MSRASVPNKWRSILYIWRIGTLYLKIRYFIAGVSLEIYRVSIPRERALVILNIFHKHFAIVTPFFIGFQDIVFHELPSLRPSRHIVGYNDEIIDLKMIDSDHVVVATNSEQVCYLVGHYNGLPTD